MGPKKRKRGRPKYDAYEKFMSKVRKGAKEFFSSPFKKQNKRKRKNK